MKIVFATVAGVLVAISLVLGATLRLPKIPVPRLSPGEVINLGKAYLSEKGATPEPLLVGVEWCQGDQFAPRYKDGTQHHISDQDWSWFLTYVQRGSGERAQQWTSVLIFRVGENGQVSPVGGT